MCVCVCVTLFPGCKKRVRYSDNHNFVEVISISKLQLDALVHSTVLLKAILQI